MDNDSIALDASQVNQLINNLLDEKGRGQLKHDLGRVMVADTMLNFRTQSSPDGEPWAPIQRKGQILRDTSRLRNSITYRLGGDDTILVGTNVAYARTHQFGFTGNQAVQAHVRLITQAFGKKLKFPVYQSVGPHTRYMSIKARRFLGFGPRAIKKIDKVLASWLDGFTV